MPGNQLSRSLAYTKANIASDRTKIGQNRECKFTGKQIQVKLTQVVDTSEIEIKSTLKSARIPALLYSEPVEQCLWQCSRRVSFQVSQCQGRSLDAFRQNLPFLGRNLSRIGARCLADDRPSVVGRFPIRYDPGQALPPRPFRSLLLAKLSRPIQPRHSAATPGRIQCYQRAVHNIGAEVEQSRC